MTHAARVTTIAILAGIAYGMHGVAGPNTAGHSQGINPQLVATTAIQDSSGTNAPLSAQLRADAIRQAIVDKYGSDQIKKEYAHPKVIPGYEYLTMQRRDIWLQAYTAGMAEGFAPKPSSSRPVPSVGKTISTGPRILSLLERVIGSVPYADLATNASQVLADRNADKLVRQKALANLGEGHIEMAEKLVKEILSPEQLDQYKAGSFAVKTSKLFQAAYTVLSRQGVPNAYVLFLCDAQDRAGKRGEGARTLLLMLSPSHKRFNQAAWNGYTVEQQWRAVTDGLMTFFKKGATSMNDPALSALFAASLPPTSLDPATSDDDIVLGALGPVALKQYMSLQKPEDREIFKNTANAVSAAFTMLLPILVGDI